ncbi:Plant basic secretory protein (BSP) family protein [Forsythia ovata]|uniref:Plant basic secretory protein (BSP) family protein n=1 Tax=Forsythia ovata TaxID=205694 RepID=A0ABD1QMC6_9LAMI
MGNLCNFLSFFLLLAAPQGLSAVKYIVTNTVPNQPGGQRFDKEIGVPYTLQNMDIINKFIWNIFEQPTNADTKTVPVLNVYISDFIDATAYTNGDNINVSAPIIQSYPPEPDRAKFTFTGIMYHEMTHIFQWSGIGTAPGGLTEGIADYVMVKSKFYDPNSYTRPGAGNRWDEGHGVTERFLEYCDSLRKGFTVALNKKMRYVYNDNYFFELLGKPLDQVWREYKVKYGNVPVSQSKLPHTKY